MNKNLLYINENKIYEELDKYKTTRENFLNRYEQMLYTLPINKIDKSIIEYRNVFDNVELFPDMDEYTNKIWKMEKVLDCRRTLFISKCHMTQIKNKSFDEFIKYVLPYRKYIKPELQRGWGNRKIQYIYR